MEAKKRGLEKFLTSWRFILLLIALQFVVLPIVTKGFRWDAVGDIIIFTLSNALIQYLYPFDWVFQIIAIIMLTLLVIRKEKFSRWFMCYAGCCFVMYAIIQNVAITEEYGLGIVTINVVMMGFVAVMWFRGALQGTTRFTFSNLNWKTAWTIPVAFFCLWWPMNMPYEVHPDFNLLYLFTGASAMAFCPMTPILLAMLILSKKDVDRALLRVTAIVGFIIGGYNMGDFATDSGFYLGLYHLPLLIMSFYALIISKKEKNK